MQSQLTPYLGDPTISKPLLFTAEVEQLRANPGQWFELSTRASDNAADVFASQIRSGRRPVFRPAGHFEARAVGTLVVARYIGGEL